jgi:hypothetical protein
MKIWIYMGQEVYPMCQHKIENGNDTILENGFHTGWSSWISKI